MKLRTRIKNRARKAVKRALGRPEAQPQTARAANTPYEPIDNVLTGAQSSDVNDDASEWGEIANEAVEQAEAASLPTEEDSSKNPAPSDPQSPETPPAETATEASAEASVESQSEKPEILTPEQIDTSKVAVEDAIKTIYDPEIPVNIYELGLIYEVDVRATGDVHVTMTLTSPNCPAAQSLPAEVKSKAQQIDLIQEAHVDIVWEPVWGPHLMSEAAQLELNL